MVQALLAGGANVLAVVPESAVGRVPAGQSPFHRAAVAAAARKPAAADVLRDLLAAGAGMGGVVRDVGGVCGRVSSLHGQQGDPPAATPSPSLVVVLWRPGADAESLDVIGDTAYDVFCMQLSAPGRSSGAPIPGEVRLKVRHRPRR